MTLGELPGFMFKASVVIVLFKLGTTATLHNMLFLIRQPSLLLRSLLSMSIIMPACAVALALAFELKAPVKWALVTLAISPIPPLLPIKQIKTGGSAPYAISLLVLEAAAAIVFVPAAVFVFGLVFHNYAHVGIPAVTLIILVTVLVPLAIGMLARYFAPNLAERIADRLGQLGSLLLLVGLAAILLINEGRMLSLIGDGPMVAILAYSVLGMAVGHLLGGPKPAERAVLALSSATRHPGVALTIATANLADHKSVQAAILIFLVVGMIVPIPYLRWIKRQLAEHSAAEKAHEIASESAVQGFDSAATLKSPGSEGSP